MRKELKEIGSENRHTFIGTFERTGTKNGYKGELKTILLLNIRDTKTDKIITDHLWFNYTKGFYEANLQKGDEVQFDARVEDYVKGYFGHKEDVYVPASTDYKLSRPTHIVNLNPARKRLDKEKYSPYAFNFKVEKSIDDKTANSTSSRVI